MKIYSIIRDEEYKKLKTFTINGNILDLGGNLNSEYHKLIKGKHTITTVNINTKYGCDMTFDIQNIFPIESKKFDAVLVMNTLEHVYNFDNVISETYRVLKKGGVFILTVPFMHHIHGSPDDYFRYTRSAIKKMLHNNNFIDIEIQEIGLGLFSLFYQSIAGAFPMFLRLIFRNFARSVDLLFCKVSKRYQNVTKRIPLGYFVVGRK